MADRVQIDAEPINSEAAYLRKIAIVERIPIDRLRYTEIKLYNTMVCLYYNIARVLNFRNGVYDFCICEVVG